MACADRQSALSIQSVVRVVRCVKATDAYTSPRVRPTLIADYRVAFAGMGPARVHASTMRCAQEAARAEEASACRHAQ